MYVHFSRCGRDAICVPFCIERFVALDYTCTQMFEYAGEIEVYVHGPRRLYILLYPHQIHTAQVIRKEHKRELARGLTPNRAFFCCKPICMNCAHTLGWAIWNKLVCFRIAYKRSIIHINYWLIARVRLKKVPISNGRSTH